MQHHYVDKLCNKHPHTEEPPEMDGYTEISFIKLGAYSKMEPLRIPFSEATPEPVNGGWVFHGHNDRHDFYPNDNIFRVTTVDCTPEWLKSFEEWYEREHGMSLKQDLDMRNKARVIEFQNEIASQIRSAKEGGFDDLLGGF